MPALQPPSMQIGALPPGYGPLPPTGPALAPAYQYAPPKIVQTVVAVSTGAAQPASFTANITGTGAGNLLLAFLGGMAQGGAQNAPTPTNFSGLSGAGGSAIAGTTCAGSWAYLPNVAAGVTSVVWPTLTNYSSCCAVVFEVSGVGVLFPANGATGPGPTFLAAGAAASASASSLAAFSQYKATSSNILGFGVSLCSTAATPSSASTPFLPPTVQWTGTGVSSSSNTQASVVNTSIVGISIQSFDFPGTSPYQVIATASVAAPLVAMGLLLTSLASQQNNDSPGRAFVVDAGGGYAVGETGNTGWALGGTKPGGAGGGQ